MDTLANRNNNPGNLRDIKTGSFRQFSTPEEGTAALYNDLSAKMTGNTTTGLHAGSSLVDFAKKYAPAGDNNDPIKYAADIANQMGISPDEKIGNLAPRIDDFANAIMKNEGYKKPTQQPQQQSGNLLINKAQASGQQPITNANAPEDWTGTALTGLGLAGASWLTSKLVPYLKEAVPAMATDAIIGGGVAGIPGAISGLGAGAVQPLIKGAISDITGGTKTQEPTPQQQQTQNASQTVNKTITDMLSSTVGNRNYSQSMEGQNAINTASIFGLIHPDENGILQFDEAKRKQYESQLERLEDEVIKSEGATASPLSAANYAGQYIGKDRYSTPVDRQKAAEIVQKELAARRIPMNGQMSLEDMRKAQKEHYQAGKSGYNNPKSTAEVLAHKALGYGFGQTIHDNVKDPGLLDRARSMSKNLTVVKDLSKRVQGRKAPKNSGVLKDLAHSGARWAAVYIGDKIGGPVGAILGDMVGIHLSRKIDKKFGSNTFETPQMKKALEILQQGSPEVYNTLIQELKNNGVQVSADDQKIEESLDTPKEMKHEIGHLKKATSGVLNNPKQKEGLLKIKPKEKNRKGLIRLPQTPPNNQ